MPDAKELMTARLTIGLHPGQSFYETPKAYEIWDEDPLRFVNRIPKKRVYWVITKTNGVELGEGIK